MEGGRTRLGTTEVVDYDMEEGYAACGGTTIDLRRKDREKDKELIPKDVCWEVVQDQME